MINSSDCRSDTSIIFYSPRSRLWQKRSSMRKLAGLLKRFREANLWKQWQAEVVYRSVIYVQVHVSIFLKEREVYIIQTLCIFCTNTLYVGVLKVPLDGVICAMPDKSDRVLHQVMPNHSVRLSLLLLLFWDRHWWKHWWKWPRYTQYTLIYGCDDLNHLASCAPASWIHARCFCDSYQDQCVGNGLCQGGLMVGKSIQVPRALRCAEKCWMCSVEKCWIRHVRTFIKTYSCFPHVSHMFALVCFELLWTCPTFLNLLARVLGTFSTWSACVAIRSQRQPAQPAMWPCTECKRFWGVTDGPRTSQARHISNSDRKEMNKSG